MDPFLEARVERLAATKQITSRGVGEDGVPSESYASFRVVIAMATKEQVFQLLKHRSPVVRGYMAAYILSAWPGEGAPILRLLTDKARVFTIFGCEVGQPTLGDYVWEELRQRRREPELRALLLAVSNDKAIPNGRRKQARAWAEGDFSR